MFKKSLKPLVISTLSILLLFSSINVFASTTTRLSGQDRYETSSKIALNGWTTSSYAILASGEDYPDALCATPLAGKYKAPILLTQKDVIPSSTLNTITQLSIKNIFLIGGTGVISYNVESQLIGLGVTVTRLAGASRYETDIKVAEQLGTVSQIAVVTGEDYADALSIAPIAVKLNMPIILVEKNSIPQVVKDYISTQSITGTYVIGKGTSIINEDGLTNVTEINGSDKYQRDLAIIDAFKGDLDFSTVYIATGENFVDSLSGSILAGKNSNPMMLLGTDVDSQRDFFDENSTAIININILGGIGAVPDNAISNLLGLTVSIDTDTISDNTDITDKFNDENFKSKIYTLIGKNSPAPIFYSDVKNIKSLDLANSYKGLNISSLSGIEYFTALTSLYCGCNQLTTLDVSKNKALDHLQCSNNKLTALDVSKNKALTFLECYYNKLTTLDVSKNKALDHLQCSNDQLTTLDVSKNKALATLDCYSNQLTTLDLSKNTALTKLTCENNQLTTLDVSKNTALTDLTCENNQLTTLDLSKNTALTNLTCENNQLTILDVSKNTALTRLFCDENQLTRLDVSENTALRGLGVSNNQLTALDVSKNTALTTLRCESNQLTTLDVSKNIALHWLYCAKNQLTTLYDISNKWNDLAYKPQYIDSSHKATTNSLFITIKK